MITSVPLSHRKGMTVFDGVVGPVRVVEVWNTEKTVGLRISVPVVVSGNDGCVCCACSCCKPEVSDSCVKSGNERCCLDV